MTREREKRTVELEDGILCTAINHAFKDGIRFPFRALEFNFNTTRFLTLFRKRRQLFRSAKDLCSIIHS